LLENDEISGVLQRMLSSLTLSRIIHVSPEHSEDAIVLQRYQCTPEISQVSRVLHRFLISPEILNFSRALQDFFTSLEIVLILQVL